MCNILNNKSIRITISLPEKDHAYLQEIANNNQISLSWLVRKAVKNLLEDPQQRKLFNEPKLVRDK
ncbi:MAG: CopG family transcriptional regulator [Legionella sp.]|nr:CopG family transcriptional regulator [Legionella sp.]